MAAMAQKNQRVAASSNLPIKASMAKRRIIIGIGMIMPCFLRFPSCFLGCL